jgi:hypothetical protein
MQQIDFRLVPELMQMAYQSENALVRDIPRIFEDLTHFRDSVERSFQWRETSVEIFKVKFLMAKTHGEANSLYWRDITSLVKTYCLSTSWRILELIEQSILLLNSPNGILGPAILGRALVELTTHFILTGDVIRLHVEEAAVRWGDAFISDANLENILTKAIYGTRLVPEDHHLRQTNILTHLQRLSRISGYEDVITKYNFLCEVAHPNVTGSARYWSDHARLQPDGTTMRSFNPRAVDNVTVKQIQDAAVWVLAWAGANVIAGFQILDARVDFIARQFPTQL